MTSGQEDTESLYSALIGPEGDRMLIFAKSEDYVANPEDELVIGRREGYVDLDDWK